jgi:hypothetical protein
MQLFSLKYVVLRYIGALILITLAALASDPKAFFIIIPVAFVSIKLLIYEGIVTAIRAKFARLKVSPWFFIGYGLTVAGDMVFAYNATRDEVDAGFAFLGTFVFTPWILVAAVIVMVVHTYRSRGRA